MARVVESLGVVGPGISGVVLSARLRHGHILRSHALVNAPAAGGGPMDGGLPLRNPVVVRVVSVFPFGAPSNPGRSGCHRHVVSDHANLWLLNSATIHSSVFPSAHVSSAFSAAWGLFAVLPPGPVFGGGCCSMPAAFPSRLSMGAIITRRMWWRDSASVSWRRRWLSRCEIVNLGRRARTFRNCRRRASESGLLRNQIDVAAANGSATREKSLTTYAETRPVRGSGILER